MILFIPLFNLNSDASYLNLWMIALASAINQMKWITWYSCGESTNSITNDVKIGDRFLIYKFILRYVLIYTGTLFSVTRHTQSWPLTPTDVIPLVLTALKAYSICSIEGYTNLIESSLWREDRDLIFMSLASSTHFFELI